MSDNFLQKFRDKDTRAFKNFTAQQFLEVWNHYDTDGSGFIEGEELNSFLREFVSSIIPDDVGGEIVSDSALDELKDEFMDAYDDNGDNRIEIAELAQMLPTEENFLVLFRRKNPLSSSVEFMRVWRQFDRDSSGHIDAEELRDFLHHILDDKQQQVTDQQLKDYADTILKLFDQNGDGQLQLSEMARLLPVRDNFLARPLLRNASRLTPADIDRVFRRYDTDRSGRIEGEELLGFLKDMLELTGEEYDDEKMRFLQQVVLQQWDADGDGGIGQEEMKMILMQHKRIAEEQQAMSRGGND